MKGVGKMKEPLLQVSEAQQEALRFLEGKYRGYFKTMIELVEKTETFAGNLSPLNELSKEDVLYALFKGYTDTKCRENTLPKQMQEKETLAQSLARGEANITQQYMQYKVERKVQEMNAVEYVLRQLGKLSLIEGLHRKE